MSEPSKETLNISTSVNHNDSGHMNSYQQNHYYKCTVVTCEK